MATGIRVRNPMSFTDPSGTSVKGALTILEAVLGWFLGTQPNTSFGPNHPVTQAIRDTPAMDNIRQQYRKKNCASQQYGDFSYREYFTTFNVVGQMIGGFCADLTNLGNGKVKVRAQNTWGTESASRIPKLWGPSNRFNASIQQMMEGKGSFFQYRNPCGRIVKPPE
jgi:hypothetical protein